VQPRRLHPASVLLGVDLRQVIQAFLFPAIATFPAGGMVTLVVLSIVAVIGLSFRILAWQRMHFSFDGEVLRVDSGVLNRSRRSLDVARIQQVEIHRGVVQRMLGLAALRVETAGSASEVEVDLRVLPEDDAVALRSAVRASKARLARDGADHDGDPEAMDAAPEEREILRVPMKHVALAAVTGAQLLVFPALIGGALQFVGQQFDRFVNQVIQQLVEAGIRSPEDVVETTPPWTLVALVVLGVLALSIVTAVVVGLLRDGRYRIVRIDDDLHVTRGLLSTRDSVVPLRRVQLVEVQRNWLRRLLGFATVRIRSAGGSSEGDGRVNVPLLPGSDVDRLLREVLPGTPGIPELTSHPPEALRRAMFRWLRPTALLAAGIWFVPDLVPFFDLPREELVRQLALAALPVAAALAYVEYRQLAHGLTDRVVASRRGALSITTSVAPVVKVQAVTSRRSFFQRRLRLTTVSAHVAGPGAVVEVLDAGVEPARVLHERLTEHAASPTVRELVPVAHHGDPPAPSGPDARGFDPSGSRG
jgi:putative membrane protein